MHFTAQESRHYYISRALQLFSFEQNDADVTKLTSYKIVSLIRIEFLASHYDRKGEFLLIHSKILAIS